MPEQYREVGDSGAVVAIEQLDLNLATTRKWDSGAKGLVRFHDQGHEIVRLEVMDQRRAARLGPALCAETESRSTARQIG